MDLSRDPSAIASAAAEEVRALNHRTLDPYAFRQPADVGDTAHHLDTLVDRLHQSLTQLRHGLEALGEQDAIRMDDGSDVGEQVSRAVRNLDYASQDLIAVHNSLKQASAVLSHMGGHFTDEEEPTV